ncbi:MAG: protein-L-isoaspartate O-methyltransferase [Thiomargarita sp.]|nr:protein-L-isoaspartate O-methyltransferase [Thiomargarita sp.]
MSKFFDVEKFRSNMIKQQIQPWEVFDQKVINLIAEVSREKFVPQDYYDLAFADINIPLGHDQVMMNPKIEARLLQALMLHRNDKVLEIGTGSGYLTALLAKLSQHVDSVDIFEDLVKTAEKNLTNLSIDNVSLSVGDAIQGWNTDTKYDVIVLTASVPSLDASFLKQLNTGGCIFAIVGREPAMQAKLIRNISAEQFDEDVLFETSIPSLIGTNQFEAFSL